MGVVRNILLSQYSEKVLQIAIFYSAPIFLHNKALSMPFHLSMNNETAQGLKCKCVQETVLNHFRTIFTQKLCLRRSADTKYFMDMTQIETHISNHHSCSWQQIKNFTEAVVARVVLWTSNERSSGPKAHPKSLLGRQMLCLSWTFSLSLFGLLLCQNMRTSKRIKVGKCFNYGVVFILFSWWP